MRQTKNQKETLALKLNLEAKQPHKQCNCETCKPLKPILPKDTRRIKIQPKYTQRTGYKEVFPSILLTGKWLREQGFKCDKYVIISEKKGQLVIKLEKQ